METQPPIGDPSLPPAIATQAVPQPRLGIVHLLLWMLVTAVLLSTQRAAAPSAASLPVSTIQHVVFALVNGATIGAALVWTTRLVSGRGSFPITGGHYFLVMSAVTMAFMLAINVLLMLFQRTKDLSETVPFMTFGAMSILGMTLALVMTALCYRQVHWMLLFLLMAGQGLLHTIMNFANAVTFGPGNLSGLQGALNVLNMTWPIVGVAVLLVLFVCVVYDVRRHGRQDWMYWTGVTAWTLGTLANFVMPMFSVLIYRR